MYSILLVIHVIVSIFLIAVILLQAGRGGGLADTFGGSQMQSLFGTKSTTVLTRLTTVCASLFIITCISLAVISSTRTKSLVDRVSIPQETQPVDVNTGAAEEQRPPAPAPPAPAEETQRSADEAE